MQRPKGEHFREKVEYCREVVEDGAVNSSSIWRLRGLWPTSTQTLKEDEGANEFGGSWDGGEAVPAA
jgi:hypothetical protein